MTNKITYLPTKLPIPPNRVLEGAIDQTNMVLVLGEGKDGNDYFACSTCNKAEILLLIERFKFKLLNGNFD